MIKQTAICDVDYDNGISVSFVGTKMGRPAEDEYERGLWAISLHVFADDRRGEPQMLNEFPIFIKEMFDASYLEVEEQMNKFFGFFAVEQPCWFYDVLDQSIHCFVLEE